MIFSKFLAAAVTSVFIACAGGVRSHAAVFGDFEYTDNGTTITIDQHTNHQKTGPVVIPSTIEGKPVTIIGPGAFWWSTKITGVTIQPGVTTVKEAAFANCAALSSVQLPEGLTTLETQAFGDCAKLRTLHLPSTLRVAADFSGYGSRLETVTFAPATPAIPARVLAGCHRVRSVTIPSSVKRIEDFAFAYCYSLETIQLPPGLTEIGMEAFSECTTVKEILIPSSVNSIGNFAFSSTAIREIHLPKNIKSLGEGVFASCWALEQVRLPSSLREIPAKSFSRCFKLETLVIPEGVTRIGEFAFTFCPFARVTFPPSIREIHKGAFMDCGSLRTAVFTGKAPSVASRIFAGTARDFTIYLEESTTRFTLPRWKGYPTTKPRPEITVTSPDGAELTHDYDVSGTTQKFPSGIVGKKDSYRNFTFLNTGIRPLTNLTATIQGGNSGDFVIKPLKKTSLAPGKAVTVRIRFSPLEAGKRRSQLRIGSNDASENPLLLALHATGLIEN